MDPIIEDTLTFTFADSVQAIKYDDSDWKNNRFANHPAMDILAREGNQQWWIEIKDCEGAEPDNLPRLSPGEPDALPLARLWIKESGYRSEVRAVRKKPFIIDELIAKLRSTLVGCSLAGFEDTDGISPDEEVGAYRLKNGDTPLVVVLYLTWDNNEFRRLARGLQIKLDRALKPYGWKGFIVNDSTGLQQTGLRCSVARQI